MSSLRAFNRSANQIFDGLEKLPKEREEVTQKSRFSEYKRMAISESIDTIDSVSLTSSSEPKVVSRELRNSAADLNVFASAEVGSASRALSKLITRRNLVDVPAEALISTAEADIVASSYAEAKIVQDYLTEARTKAPGLDYDWKEAPRDAAKAKVLSRIRQGLDSEDLRYDLNLALTRSARFSGPGFECVFPTYSTTGTQRGTFNGSYLVPPAVGNGYATAAANAILAALADDMLDGLSWQQSPTGLHIAHGPGDAANGFVPAMAVTFPAALASSIVDVELSVSQGYFDLTGDAYISAAASYAHALGLDVGVPGLPTPITLNCNGKTVFMRFRKMYTTDREAVADESYALYGQIDVPRDQNLSVVFPGTGIVATGFTASIALSAYIPHIGSAIGIGNGGDFLDLIKAPAGDESRCLLLAAKVLESDMLKELRCYEEYRVTNGYQSVASAMVAAATATYPASRLHVAGWIVPSTMEIFTYEWWLNIKESFVASNMDITFAWARFLGLCEVLVSCAKADITYLESRM
jgi:hypothetical protein